MRLLPTRKFIGKPLKIKPYPADLQHFTAPLKGLDLSSKLTVGDPLTAPILTNYVIEEDKIRARPGTKLRQTLPEAVAIDTIIPFYGATETLALATPTKVYAADNTVLKSGLGSGNWNWTSFANLSQQKYTIGVNGTDGVHSWDGTPLAAGFVKETITAEAGATHVNPDKFHTILSHMNRLWFADRINLAVYYLPIQQKDGEVKELPLNAYFRRGSFIRAIYNWTVDGGNGIDDKLVIFTNNGECAIFSGIDPDTDFELVGIFRFDAPMSMTSILNYGGDLYVMTATGLLPMTTLLRAETEKLGGYDVKVQSVFRELGVRFRELGRGWQVILDQNSNSVICNMPLGGKNRYRQMVRRMTGAAWAMWEDLPARCWQWINDGLVIGSDDGKLYTVSPTYLNDDGRPIRTDVQWAWSLFKTPGIKQFKMVRVYILTDGNPTIAVDIRCDYDKSDPDNYPDASGEIEGATWDLSDWDTSDWAAGEKVRMQWQGVDGLGRVGAVRLQALVSNSSFAIAGIDVIYEKGAAV